MDWPSGTAVGRIMCNDDEWTVTLDYGKVMIIPPDLRDPRGRILNGPPTALPRGRDRYEVQGPNGPVHHDDLIVVEPGEVVHVEVYLRRSGVTGEVAHPCTLRVTTSVLEVFLSVVDQSPESDEEIYEDLAHESTSEIDRTRERFVAATRATFFVTTSVGETSVTVPGAVVSTTPREVATPREVEEVTTRGPLHDHVIRVPGGSFVDEYHALHREIHVMRHPETQSRGFLHGHVTRTRTPELVD